MLQAATKTAAALWCGVVMPDHVHLLVSAAQGKSPLDTAACFKRLTTIAVRAQGFSGDLWQRRIHDRGIRADFDNDVDAAACYVLDNPVRRGFVESWEQWPFSHLHQGIATLG
jgi:REP element-mobilizing transposase RayT